MLADSIISDANLKRLCRDRPVLYTLCDEELSERDLAQIMKYLDYYSIRVGILDKPSTSKGKIAFKCYIDRPHFFKLFYLVALWQQGNEYERYPQKTSYVYKTEIHHFRTIISDSLNPTGGIYSCFNSMGITDRDCEISNIYNTINFTPFGARRLFKLILRSLNMYRY